MMKLSAKTSAPPPLPRDLIISDLSDPHQSETNCQGSRKACAKRARERERERERELTTITVETEWRGAIQNHIQAWSNTPFALFTGPPSFLTVTLLTVPSPSCQTLTL